MTPYEQWLAWLYEAADQARLSGHPVDAQDMAKRFRRGLKPSEAVAELLQELHDR